MSKGIGTCVNFLFTEMVLVTGKHSSFMLVCPVDLLHIKCLSQTLISLPTRVHKPSQMLTYGLLMMAMVVGPPVRVNDTCKEQFRQVAES